MPLVNRFAVHHTSITPKRPNFFMRDSMKPRVASLSPRQRQIVRLTSLGCTSREIATILSMSRWTVENHQFLAKERLGVSKAAVLTRIAIKYKISPLNDQLTPAEQRKLAGQSERQMVAAKSKQRGAAGKRKSRKPPRKRPR